MVSSEAVNAMKTMAKDPKKRLALAKDPTCIGGLIIVLSNSDANVVTQALQTLHLLCESPDSHRLLSNHVGIKYQLELVEKSASVGGHIQALARDLTRRLHEPCVAPLRDSSNIPRNAANRKSSHGESKTKSIVLQIRGLQDKSDRDLCSRLLLNVKGVISITYDLNQKRCILRTKTDVKSEALASSITRSMTMVARQVIRNEKGEEFLVSFNNSLHKQEDAPETVELPDYLSDDSDQSFVGDKAVKPPSEEDHKKSAGWFSAAASFLTNSFYW